MNAVGHATATRVPETTPARPHAGGDCCAAEVTVDAAVSSMTVCFFSSREAMVF